MIRTKNTHTLALLSHSKQHTKWPIVTAANDTQQKQNFARDCATCAQSADYQTDSRFNMTGPWPSIHDQEP